MVVLSGGQDSTTCLYWAIKKFGDEALESVTFDYGQRHRIELECASGIAAKAGMRLTDDGGAIVFGEMDWTVVSR